MLPHSNQKPSGLHRISFLTFFLCVTTILHGQTDDAKEGIITDLDSLYRLLYEFNFTEEEKNGQDFKDFPGVVNQLAEQSMEMDFDQGYFKSQNMLYLYYKYADEMPNAFGVIDGAVSKANKEGKMKYVAQFTYLRGTQFHRYDEYDSSLVYFEKAYGIAESIDNRQVMASAINALAATYGKLRKPEQAMTYYKKALPIAKASGDSLLIGMLIGNIGLSFARLEQADSALFYGQQQLGMAERNGEPAEIRQALNVMTMASYLKGSYQDALAYSDRLYKIIEPTEDWGFMITPYLYRAKTWKALGDITRALEDVNRSIEIAKEVEYISGEMNALEWLIALNEELGTYESAFKLLERLAALKDGEKERQATQKIEKMALRYEIKEKDSSLKNMAKVQEATTAKLKFRNLMIASVILVFLIIVSFTVWLYKGKVEKQKMAAQESQNKLLRSQLNPHFLFNALSSIQLFMINKGQGPQALEYLSKFAKLMRRILENSRESFVSLEDELATLRHYLDLQRIRFDNKFEYEIEVSTEHETEDITIPPMFAQPFIENSLEHGIANLENGRIAISFEETNGTLSFRVEDNGIGITRSARMKKRTEHQSLATTITRDRIALLRKQLKRRISFNVRDKHDEAEQVVGTEVIFELPIIYRFS
ncbi:MAG: histidine kinase [Roseivirga sp.]|nr:histidine kinase [Roseivirga sp.]